MTPVSGGRLPRPPPCAPAAGGAAVAAWALAPACAPRALSAFGARPARPLPVFKILEQSGNDTFHRVLHQITVEMRPPPAQSIALSRRQSCRARAPSESDPPERS